MYLRTSGSQILQKMLKFSKPSSGWHFFRCAEATSWKNRELITDHNKDNFFQEKNDIHLEANSNEIAASIFTFNCTPGSKVNLCKRKHLQDDSTSPVLMNFHKKNF